MMRVDALFPTAAAVVALAFSAGCATPPDKVSAAYVSPMQYSAYSCGQIEGELRRVQRQLVQVTGAQQKEANKDAIAMGVGLVVFWPALFFLAGDDQKAELARLKGEYEALQSAAIRKDCDFASQMEQAG
ncbi:hypothetical protein [uncultured Thiohalocapsa sp.]|uniref:hypothetical protein n=1 Tax=uncultured Thiohalocapsa sp. TaxID=768990 RepID=UPI0025D8D1CD|nr:hypothetical protein [uncultured Thiohalocapsa sp.]